MGKKEKRNYEDMDCLEVNLNVKAGNHSIFRLDISC